MSRLLQKPLKLFILYALIVLACSVPVYYYVINSIWESELDEHNQMAAEFTKAKLAHIDLDEQELSRLLKLWNNIKPGATIEPTDLLVFPPDSVYTVSRTDKHVSYEPIDSFRGLITYLTIHDKPYKLIIETNSEEAVPALRVIGTTTLLFFLILIAGFILLNRYVSSKIWKPFWQTLARLKEFDLHSERKLQLPESDIAEFEELNQEIHKLIARNIATFQSQKQFTENASHELQTPLAVMQSKLDLLLQESNLTEDQHQLIEDINDALSRTAKINKNLLMLAKIDNQQFDMLEDVDLNQEVEDIIQMLPEDLHDKDMSLEIQADQAVMVRMNKTLAQILIQNLLSNAYRHSRPSAKLLVILNRNKLEVSNTGDEALDNDRLFKRFSNVSKETGIGLGLAIVRQICLSYGWDVQYAFIGNKHTFTIRFC